VKPWNGPQPRERQQQHPARRLQPPPGCRRPPLEPSARPPEAVPQDSRVSPAQSATPPPVLEEPPELVPAEPRPPRPTRGLLGVRRAVRAAALAPAGRHSSEPRELPPRQPEKHHLPLALKPRAVRSSRELLSRVRRQPRRHRKSMSPALKLPDLRHPQYPR